MAASRSASGENEDTTVLVENLDVETTPEDVQACFEDVGTVLSVSRVESKNPNTRSARVVFSSPAEAKLAIAEFNGAEADGYILKVSLVPAISTALRPTAPAFQVDPKPDSYDSTDKKIQKPTSYALPTPDTSLSPSDVVDSKQKDATPSANTKGESNVLADVTNVSWPSSVPTSAHTTPSAVSKAFEYLEEVTKASSDERAVLIQTSEPLSSRSRAIPIIKPPQKTVDPPKKPVDGRKSDEEKSTVSSVICSPKTTPKTTPSPQSDVDDKKSDRGESAVSSAPPSKNTTSEKKEAANDAWESSSAPTKSDTGKAQEDAWGTPDPNAKEWGEEEKGKDQLAQSHKTNDKGAEKATPIPTIRTAGVQMLLDARRTRIAQGTLPFAQPFVPMPFTAPQASQHVNLSASAAPFNPYAAQFIPGQPFTSPATQLRAPMPPFNPYRNAMSIQTDAYRVALAYLTAGNAIGEAAASASLAYNPNAAEFKPAAAPQSAKEDALPVELGEYVEMIRKAGITSHSELKGLVPDRSALDAFVSDLAKDVPGELDTFAGKFRLKSRLAKVLDLKL